MPRTIGVVGDDGVGKTSFIRALGAQEVTCNPPRRHLSPTYLWSRPGADSVEKTAVNIYRSREEVASDGAFVLLFDLTRRESLAAVIAQWAHLADAPNRRLLLVGTHVDCVADREVLAAEARELAASEFHGYDEVCCSVGQIDDGGMIRIQNLLAQWTLGQAASETTSKKQSMRSSERPKERPLCPIVTAIPTTSQSLPASPAAQQKPCMRASVWLYDPTEDVPSSPVAGAGGDVKLRAISKAIYDIRGAGAEKSKALAKYRDREMHQWLLRSRYFGPTESSRHKRWQEEQKKRTQTHQHSRSRHQPSAQELPQQQEQRGRSVSHPGKFEPPNLKPKARHHASSRFSSSSSSSSDSEEPPTTPLERKSFMQPTELTVLRLRQLEADASQLAQQKKKRAAKRAMRKQRRTASNDLYERSSASAAALDTYMICCDELEMPLQLQPPSPSLSRKAVLKTASTSSSPGSWTRRRNVDDGQHGTTLAVGGRAASHALRRAMKDDVVSAREQHELELYSPGAERVACLPTPLPTAHLQSPVPPVMSPPASPYQSPPTITSDGGPAISKEESLSACTDATVGTTEWKSSPTKPALLAPTAYPVAGTDAINEHVQPPCNPPGVLAASQANTVCSSASEDLDFSDIDDMLEYFEGVTLPI
ncbi:hypothetical protein BBJ28_00003145 [Nothophytophthora sp. Chile5]|nr:hypothetical protein BBJ28_00003145 [Nothophytophthora sp. Chile5]